MGLSVKQKRFADVFLATGDKIQSVIASHNCKSENASSMACQVFNSPKVKQYLAEYALSKPKQITKEDYIDRAMSIHDSLEKTEANAPRYYDIAGKALGYIGNNQDTRPNQTLVINVDTRSMDRNTLLDNVRRLLSDNSQP